MSKKNNRKISFALALLFGGTCSVWAQGPVDLPPNTLTQGDISGSPLNILSAFSEGKSYLDFNGFVNGVVDSSAPVFQSGVYLGNTSNTGFGYEAGGGVSASRVFSTGQFLLGYTGAFRDYTTALYPSGTNQNINVYLTKLLSRQWSLRVGGNAGIFLNGGSAYQLNNSVNGLNLGQGPVLNPFSQTTKYVGSSISLSYQQSLRWSYTIGGDFFLSRYTGNGSFGSTGGDGTGSVTYRLTAVTSLSGSYSHSYYGYQNAAGSSAVDSVFGTLSHDFRRAHWKVGVSGGVSRANSSGAFFIPGFLPAAANQQLIGVVTQGAYNTVSVFPSFQGSATRTWRRTSLNLSGGQAVSSGNGIYLTSRNLFFSGGYNISSRRSGLSFTGIYSQLNSVTNSISSSYGSSGANVSYTYKLARHFGVNGAYNLTYYSNIGNFGGRISNRLSFGVTFFSSNVPLSYF